MARIPKDWIKKVKDLVSSEIVAHPPVIGVIGVSGVGKSSTLNALFKTELPVSNTVACTKFFTEKSLNVAFKKGSKSEGSTSLSVIDAPGLGEDINLDPEYLQMYRDNLDRCDVILWVMTARNRAIALDQLYLKELLAFKDKIVFGINQVELIEPQAWNLNINYPEALQIKNMAIIEQDKKEKLEGIIGGEISICSYSAHKKYNLELLFSHIIARCPNNRKWVFEGLKNFHFSDFLPADIKQQITL
jgi:predicted GTPase